MDYCDKLKHYLDDLSENADLINEAIATLEGHFELISENELLHFSRIDAIAYLALKSIVRCKGCLHWDDHVEECSNPDSICFRNGWTKPEWFCADGERKE